jgi:hypothetical protein
MGERTLTVSGPHGDSRRDRGVRVERLVVSGLKMDPRRERERGRRVADEEREKGGLADEEERERKLGS